MPFTVNIYPSASVLHKMHLQSVPAHLQESSVFKVTTLLPFPPSCVEVLFTLKEAFLSLQHGQKKKQRRLSLTSFFPSSF